MMAALRITFAMVLLACVFNEYESFQQEGKKRLSDLIRKKRAPQTYYSSWTPPYLTAIISIPLQQGLTLWQPQQYQLQRPYFIPVLGASGQVPLYFPPQPINNNPGYPVDNPPSNAYLPPKPSEENSTVSTINKFDGDDRPIWDMSDGDNKASTVKPTRRPRPSGLATSTHPPIIRDEHTTVSSSAANSNKINGDQGGAAESVVPPNQNLPSRCVWAIISCCSASSNKVSYDCFEQLGCTGAFWDDSPCDGDVARAAISNVMNYYQSK